MRGANPAVIPRNHRIEAALDAAVAGNLTPFEDLLRILVAPWAESPQGLPYRRPPEAHEVIHKTFCGT